MMGGTPRKLVAQGAWPAVSPDGATIAYLASAIQFKDISLDKEVWLVRSDGQGPRRAELEVAMMFSARQYGRRMESISPSCAVNLSQACPSFDANWKP